MSEILGKGTYGKIYADGNTAIKSIKIKNCLESAIREICELNICKHKNIIEIKNIEHVAGRIEIRVKKYYCDMGNYLEKHARFPISHLRTCTYELLSAVAYMHSIGIIHCDIKPQNILIDVCADVCTHVCTDTCTYVCTHVCSDISLVLCDFGISVLTRERMHTSVVQTHTYRAPEIDIDSKLMEYST